MTSVLPGMGYAGDEGSHGEEEGIMASFKAEEPTEPEAEHEEEEEVEEEYDDVFMVNPPASDISYGSRSGSNDRYGDATMGDVEMMQMATVNPSEGSPKDPPTPSLLMASDQDKVGIFSDRAIGIPLVDNDNLENGSELGNGSAYSAEGGDGPSVPKGSKLGQFGRFKMDWGASKLSPKSDPEPPKRKSRYKKNVIPANQKSASHKAQRNRDKMKELNYEHTDY